MRAEQIVNQFLGKLEAHQRTIKRINSRFNLSDLQGELTKEEWLEYYHSRTEIYKAAALICKGEEKERYARVANASYAQKMMLLKH